MLELTALLGAGLLVEPEGLSVGRDDRVTCAGRQHAFTSGAQAMPRAPWTNGTMDNRHPTWLLRRHECGVRTMLRTIGHGFNA
ncbi:MAG: hypothetical protein R2712_20530 [Vicinamibacterales bacterium]